MFVSPFLQKLARRAGTHRRFTLFFGLLLVAAILVPFATHGAGGQDESAPRVQRAASKSGARAAEFVPGRVLVRFRSEAAAESVETVSRSTGRALLATEDGEQVSARVERFEGSDLVRGLRLAYVAPAQTLAAVEAFKSRDDVLYAEPDYVRHASANVPNDTLFGNLWAMQNTGQAGGAVGADIKATQAWDITQGSASIVVGVIDEGVDISHPDLATNIWTNPGEIAGNGVDDDGDGKIDDVHGWDFSTCIGSPADPATNGCGNNTVYDGPGNNTNTNLPIDAHATHVAGTIGAVGNNGQGVVGVNWNVKIMPLKFLGVGTNNSASNAIRAEAYAKAMRDKFDQTGGAQGANVRVLNNSYGGGNSSQAEFDSIKAVGDSGILFVVAAGNDSSNNDLVPTFPSSYDAPNLISVAATNRFDQIDPSYSNFGARTVHIAAPGTSIQSTFPGNTYATISGTSMATPQVSGVAALALAANPNLTVQQLRSIVLYNGDVINSTVGNVYSQRRLDALGAVQAALENDTTAPAAAANLQVAAQNGRSVTLNFNAPGDDGSSGNAALYEISYASGTSAATFVLKTAIPKSPGSPESFTVNVPLRQTTGALRVKTIDNVGNESLAAVGVAVPANAADPYTTAESAFAGLAAQGTALGFHADDNYTTVQLPSGFSFPFFGQQNTSVVLSSNGNLYLQPLATLPPVNPNNNQFGDSGSSTQQLEGFKMIAGLWDDLRTDCTTGGSGLPCDVYMNTSDPNKVIFRWEARTFNSSADAGRPVEFEIELNRDGTIQTRYGAGNISVFPVVGIGAGEQGGSYVVTSHTNTDVPITLTNAPTVTFAPRPLAVPAALQFSASNFTASEAAGAVQITVTRTGSTSGAASVNYATSNGTATAGADYSAASGTLNFADGETSKTFSVAITNDSLDEADETVNLTLSSPSGATLGTPSTATLTITDDDPTPSLSINDTSLVEGNSGATNATFNVTLSAASSQTVTVNYSTADGSATAGSDYAATSGTLTFLPGETSKQINVIVIGDATVEPDENFFVNLTLPTDATLADGQGVCLIQNDDALATPTPTPIVSLVQFAAASVTASESNGTAQITITRSGDTSSAVSVDVRTVDDTRAIPCNDTTTAPGVAFARCDYATTAQIVSFAAGDALPKTVAVPLINDSYVEPNENITLALSNAAGAALGAQSTTTLTITSDDAAGAPNPINGTDFFVRMQYLDFLSRDPEPGQPWSAVLNGCANQFNTDPNNASAACDRISVSANFFRSQEFQLKGFFVFNFYKSSLARLPFYAEIVSDMSIITATTPAEVQAKKAAFTNAFVQRQEFKNLYDAMDNATFVNTLMNRYGVQSITTPDPLNPDASTRVTFTRADLVNRLNGVGGTFTRAQVVRAIADSNEVSATEFNSAFVAMQYFGYLRRDPDTQGFNDWLRTINANPADFRSMVNGFMNSQEYRLRFGTP
jgi:subtilisin family serine protease